MNIRSRRGADCNTFIFPQRAWNRTVQISYRARRCAIIYMSLHKTFLTSSINSRKSGTDDAITYFQNYTFVIAVFYPACTAISRANLNFPGGGGDGPNATSVLLIGRNRESCRFVPHSDRNSKRTKDWSAGARKRKRHVARETHSQRLVAIFPVAALF